MYRYWAGTEKSRFWKKLGFRFFVFRFERFLVFKGFKNL